ncbi:MAG: hypothetical protein HGA67_01625 [Candidatus Yonathbacteria bacterium]|nr:hypothetical protein [Candidatus Yonathbacteria bacterium]
MNTFYTIMKKMFRAKAFLGGTIATALMCALVGVPNAYAMITSQLDLGDRGAQVSELQTYLSTDATLYPSGLVTGYFGALTQTGVQKFQVAQGIVSSGTPATTGYGRVGPATRTAINMKLAGGDDSAPLINQVNVNPSSTSAIVTWTASEAAYGKVYYSTSPIRISNLFDITGVFSGEPTVTGTLAEYDNNPRVTHTVNISGLTSNTTYYYLVVVFDATKNVSITLPVSFRTTQ